MKRLSLTEHYLSATSRPAPLSKELEMNEPQTNDVGIEVIQALPARTRRVLAGVAIALLALACLGLVVTNLA
jgi:hypothetical protein